MRLALTAEVDADSGVCHIRGAKVSPSQYPRPSPVPVLQGHAHVSTDGTASLRRGKASTHVFVFYP